MITITFFSPLSPTKNMSSSTKKQKRRHLQLPSSSSSSGQKEEEEKKQEEVKQQPPHSVEVKQNENDIPPYMDEETGISNPLGDNKKESNPVTNPKELALSQIDKDNKEEIEKKSQQIEKLINELHVDMKSLTLLPENVKKHNEENPLNFDFYYDILKSDEKWFENFNLDDFDFQTRTPANPTSKPTILFLYKGKHLKKGLEVIAPPLKLTTSLFCDRSCYFGNFGCDRTVPYPPKDLEDATRRATADMFAVWGDKSEHLPGVLKKAQKFFSGLDEKFKTYYFGDKYNKGPNYKDFVIAASKGKAPPESKRATNPANKDEVAEIENKNREAKEAYDEMVCTNMKNQCYNSPLTEGMSGFELEIKDSVIGHFDSGRMMTPYYTNMPNLKTHIITLNSIKPEYGPNDVREWIMIDGKWSKQKIEYVNIVKDNVYIIRFIVDVDDFFSPKTPYPKIKFRMTPTDWYYLGKAIELPLPGLAPIPRAQLPNPYAHLNLNPNVGNEVLMKRLASENRHQTDISAACVDKTITTNIQNISRKFKETIKQGQPPPSNLNNNGYMSPVNGYLPPPSSHNNTYQSITYTATTYRPH